MPISLEEYKAQRRAGTSTGVTTPPSLEEYKAQRRQGASSQAPSTNLLDIAAGGTPQDLYTLAEGYKKAGMPGDEFLARSGGAIQQAGKDLTTIPAHFANQMLLNYPRAITEKLGYEYPEESENPLIQKAAQAAGVAGGFKSPIGRVAGKIIGTGVKTARIPSLLRSSAAGALTGAAYSPEDVTDLGARGTQAAIGGTLGFAAPLAARAVSEIPSLFGKVSRKGAQISTQSVKWLKQRGASKIFDKAKEQVDYVKTTLAPEVHAVYEHNVSKFTEPIRKYAVKKLKVPQEAVNKIKTKGIDYVNKVRQGLSDSSEPIRQRMDTGIQNKVDQAGQMFDDALDKIPDEYIPFNKTFKSLTKVLKQYNMIGDNGKLNTTVNEAPESMKALVTLYERMVGTGVKHPKTVFTFTRARLRGLQKKSEGFGKPLQEIIESLYDDAGDAGGKGIKLAKNAYRKAITAQKSYGGKFSESKLDKFHKMSQKDKASLKNIEQLIGDNFTDDLDSLVSARELDKFNKIDIAKLGEKLQKATNPRDTIAVQRELSEIFGEPQAQHITDKIKDHIAALEFTGKSTDASASRAGIVRGFLRPATKAYYEKTRPAVRKGFKSAKSVIDNLKKNK